MSDFVVINSHWNQLFGTIFNPRFTDADYIGPVDMRGMVIDKEVMMIVMNTMNTITVTMMNDSNDDDDSHHQYDGDAGVHCIGKCSKTHL